MANSNNSTDKFVALYKPSICICINEETNLFVSRSDIVSISFIHNYDTATYPIIRLRLYLDFSYIQQICEYPDNTRVICQLASGIYKMNEEDKSPAIVGVGRDLEFTLKAYIEQKNIPTSYMDQFQQGIKKSDDQNSNMKIPFELYCYNESLIHNMKQKVHSIYKQMSLTSIIEEMFQKNDVLDYAIDKILNQTKYDQVLFPNLSILQAISFLDAKYGLYRKGAQLYGDIDKLYLCDTDVNTSLTTVPIYVENNKSNSDMSGMRRISNNRFCLYTLAGFVSVKTESDIERVLHAPQLASINLSDLSVNVDELTNLFENTKNYALSKNISVPDILHKTKNEYVASSYIARLDENITEVDLSGTGFDIMKINPRTRFNLVFSSAIRGLNINKRYRAKYVCHVLSNLDSDLFIAQTTMTLCTN